MNCFTDAMRKYFVWQGRANRAQFWVFALCSGLIVSIGGAVLEKLFGDSSRVFTALLTLFFYIPGLSVLIRRLHDTDRSGWWFWIQFVPLIGTVWIFILLLLPGTPGPNRFGDVPGKN